MRKEWIPAFLAMLALSVAGCDKKEDAATEEEGDEQPAVNGGDQPDGSEDGSGDDGGVDVDVPDDDADDDVAADDGTDDDDVVVDDIHFKVDYKLNRRVYVDDEIGSAMSRVEFEHDGDEATCSADAGVTFAPCDNDFYYDWALADRANEHIIRITKAGAANSPQEFHFTPATDFPDIQTVACDVEVSADENFTAFNARLTAGTVVCVSNGVTITNDGTEGTLDPQDDSVIIARLGDVATLINSRNDATAHVFEFWFNGDRAKLVGLTVEHAGGISAGAQITWVDDVYVNDCIFRSDGTHALDIQSATVTLEGVQVESSTPGVEGLSISDATVVAHDLNAETMGAAVALGNGGHLTVERFQLMSMGAQTVYISDSGANPTSFVASHGFIMNLYDNMMNSAVYAELADAPGTTISLQKVAIVTASNGFLGVGGAMASSIAFDDVGIAHFDAGQTNNYGVNLVGTAGNADLLSVSNHMLVCHFEPTYVFDRALDTSSGDDQNGWNPADTFAVCPDDVDWLN